jgi:hypothetical protein
LAVEAESLAELLAAANEGSKVRNAPWRETKRRSLRLFMAMGI